MYLEALNSILCLKYLNSFRFRQRCRHIWKLAQKIERWKKFKWKFSITFSVNLQKSYFSKSEPKNIFIISSTEFFSAHLLVYCTNMFLMRTILSNIFLILNSWCYAWIRTGGLLYIFIGRSRSWNSSFNSLSISLKL